MQRWKQIRCNFVFIYLYMVTKMPEGEVEVTILKLIILSTHVYE